MKWALALTLLAAPLAPALASKDLFTPQDFWLWREADDPRISPDGQNVVFVEKWNDRTRNESSSNLWIVTASGKQHRQWTEGSWRDTFPRWSPDGRQIAWISDRTGSAQIFVSRLDEKIGKPITSLDSPPLNLAWSPDGNFIAFTARTPAESATPKWAPAAILPFLQPAVSGYLQVFVVPSNGGTPRRLTQGNFDCLGEPAWMPDGRSIVAAQDGSISEYRVGGGSVRVLVKGPGRYSGVLPSPDGARIAYLYAESKPQSYVMRRLFVMNPDGARSRELAGTLDRDPVFPQWSSDSRTIYFLADDHGVTRVYGARNNGTVRQVTRPRERLRGFSLADNGRAAAVRSAGLDANEVVSFTVDVDSQPGSLAAPNTHLLGERETGAIEEIDYPSDGQSIQAWIVKPPRFDPSRKYPLLLDVQDSPRAMCGIEFRLRAQIFAARGFVVLCANPRGTPGYGEHFGHLLRTRYPGDDFDDLMRGVDFMISRGYIDTQRLAITGGLLAAWAIGHTDRFHTAVARRPITDFATHVTTQPDGSRHALEWMGSLPWDDPEQYRKHSPIYFAGNFKTPTLVLAGENDPESRSLYSALQAKNVDTALVHLPAHGKPGEQVLEMETILAWLER